MPRNRVLYVNVGGQLYATTDATLFSQLAAGSRLQQAVAAHVAITNVGQEHPTILQDPAHPGAVFIDRDGPSFRYVLNYLRNAGQLVPPDDMCSAQQLLQEAQYYQLPGLITLMQEHIQTLQQGHVAAPGYMAPAWQIAMSECEAAVMEVLLASNVDYGMHIDAVCNSLLDRYTRAEVERAMAHLLEHAYVYNTVDDHHYRCT